MWGHTLKLGCIIWISVIVCDLVCGNCPDMDGNLKLWSVPETWTRTNSAVSFVIPIGRLQYQTDKIMRNKSSYIKIEFYD